MNLIFFSLFLSIFNPGYTLHLEQECFPSPKINQDTPIIYLDWWEYESNHLHRYLYTKSNCYVI